MALAGKIVALKSIGPETMGFEYRHPQYDKPIEIRQVWVIEYARTSGYSFCQPADAIGKDATVTDGMVSCYLGNGNYVKGPLVGGGSGKSIVCEQIPIPRPRNVRSELRWYYGAWQKLTRKGWVNV